MKLFPSSPPKLHRQTGGRRLAGHPTKGPTARDLPRGREILGWEDRFSVAHFGNGCENTKFPPSGRVASLSIVRREQKQNPVSPRPPATSEHESKHQGQLHRTRQRAFTLLFRKSWSSLCKQSSLQSLSLCASTQSGALFLPLQRPAIFSRKPIQRTQLQIAQHGAVVRSPARGRPRRR